MQTLINVIDYGLDPGRAVSAGRIHHQFMPDEIRADRWGLELATRRALEEKGHRIQLTEPWGDGEAVVVDPATGLRYAGSDARNDGAGLGQD